MSQRYGEWDSPISARQVASGAVEFGGVAVDDGTPYWLERRPAEDGRGVLVRRDDDGTDRAITPDDVDVRTTVHEYGGGDFAVRDGTVVYSRFEDQRLYRTDDEGSDPVPITPAPPEQQAHRYADLSFTPSGDRLYCVRERHPVESDRASDEKEGAGAEPVNELVALSVEEGGEPTVVASGHDFYSFPRIAPDGERLAWTTWDHPRMPWDGTELHVADIESGGTLASERVVMGGPEESVFQPSWGPDGTLYAVSDRTGWWNVYRIADGDPQPIHQDDAEYGTPQWVFGLATYAVMDDGTILAVRSEASRHDLVELDPETGERESVGLPYVAYRYPRLASDGESLVAVAAGPATPPSVIRWTPDGASEVLRQSFTLDVGPGMLSEPAHVTFPTGEDGGEQAHALYYPPQHADYEAASGENARAGAGEEDDAPPLVVKVHGGPTSQTLPVTDLEIQYFTTRGIGVVDVNYRGSTGYGRAYRERLTGEWGVVDTEDCVAAAEYLADQGRADPDRLAIRGGSAGGYATLCALAFHGVFDAGTSYYGVTDLRALAEHTHKFESRYLDSLVGPLPEAEGVYEDRSPAEHAGQITTPLLVLQGGEDRVVPPEQAETLVAALVDNGTPYAYVEFPEERHSFRTAEAREVALTAELRFYGELFGFDPADDLEPFDLARGEFQKRTVGEDDGD
jgi:dipeptidyl aminopeptidase/acylaminoacyl peptidase